LGILLIGAFTPGAGHEIERNKAYTDSVLHVSHASAKHFGFGFMYREYLLNVIVMSLTSKRFLGTVSI
jgi:hypothetical protein